MDKEDAVKEDSLIKKIGEFVKIIYGRVLRENADGVVEIYDRIKNEFIKTHLSKQVLIDINPSHWISQEAVRLTIEIFVSSCRSHKSDPRTKETITIIHKLVLKSIKEVIDNGKFVTYEGVTIGVTPKIRQAFKEAYEAINPPAKGK